ncbi:MAG: flagellar basal body-associated FliL family protein [Betaproteobacteria bacterium]
MNAESVKDEVMSEVETEESGGKGGLVKIILIVVGVLLLISLTIVGTLFAVGFFDEKPPEENPEAVLEEMEAELDETAAAMGGPSALTAEIEQKFLISYYVFADPFTVNLKGSRKVMQAKIGLSTYFDKATMFNDEEGSEGWIPRHLVGIRAEILRVLRSASEAQLASADSERALLEEVKMVVNETLEKYEKTTATPIENAYFTEFIIQ